MSTDEKVTLFRTYLDKALRMMNDAAFALDIDALDGYIKEFTNWIKTADMEAETMAKMIEKRAMITEAMSKEVVRDGE